MNHDPERCLCGIYRRQYLAFYRLLQHRESGQQHYLITDKGFALILNANPREYYDNICDAGWQREHEIAELGDGERQEFTKAALSLLRAYLAEDTGSARAGGITEQDIINHEEAWECLD